MKIFLCTSFTSKILPDGSVEPSYRWAIETIIDALELMGHQVFCGMREDNWSLNSQDPVQAFDYDTNSIRDSDVVVALVKNVPPSAGTQFELGFAFALSKRTYVFFSSEDKPIPYINQGLKEQNLVSFISYESLDSVAQKLKEMSIG
jgi:nucleoside 2-deoxyribosyltransferase